METDLMMTILMREYSNSGRDRNDNDRMRGR